VKRIVVFILLVTYTFSSIGATIHLHFCMNKFVGTNLFHNDNEACGKCGMKEDATKKGCCKDEVQKIKITDEHQKSISEFGSFISFVIILIENYFTEFTLNKFETTVSSTTFHPPPNIQYQNLQILYSTFLI
jgi:hypothetical protein